MKTDEELDHSDKRSTALAWLTDEDTRCLVDRVARLECLAENSPTTGICMFPGGIIAKSLFEEMRYCFAYGQFLATTLLGLAYIEHTLAALFFASGRNDLERASFLRLLSQARIEGVISNSEFETLKRLRRTRNSYAHFRRPLHKDTPEFRAVRDDEMPYSLFEQDAVVVVLAVLRMVSMNAI